MQTALVAPRLFFSENANGVISLGDAVKIDSVRPSVPRIALAIVAATWLLASRRVSAQTVTVNWTGPCPVSGDANAPCQTMDGFGVSQTGGDPSFLPDPEGFAKVLYDWSPAIRTEILDKTFSQTLGIGLTILRSKIRPNLNPSPGVFDDSDQYQVWLMQEARARGPVKLMGTVWSPPAWMKTNGRTSSGVCRNNNNTPCRTNPDCGCTANPPIEGNCGNLVCDGQRTDINPSLGTKLRTDKYADFAAYLRHYANDYATSHSVPISAISIANEPDSTQTWDSCEWSGNDIKNFLAGSGSINTDLNAITNAGVQIVAPETVNWSAAEPLMSATYSSSTARARIAIEGSHLYGGDPTGHFSNAKAYNKKTWVTEASGIHNVWGPDPLNPVNVDMDGAIEWAKSIHNSIVLGRANAWIWWNLALWQNSQSLIGLTTVNGVQGRVFSKTFWALGNFSKFVRPGYVRMNATGSPQDIFVSAYRDPVTDQFAIVVVNASFSNKSITFNVSGKYVHEVTPYITSVNHDLVPLAPTYFSAPQTINARSVMTFVSHSRNLNIWAAKSGAKAIAADFNADGKADIAIVGDAGANSIPVAFSNGNGTFSTTNFLQTTFAQWASTAGAQVVAGDLNRDGRDDLIVVGGANWSTVNVAYSNGNGSFTTQQIFDTTLSTLAKAQGVKVLSGDMNNDGRDDLVMVGGAGWTNIPVGITQSSGAAFTTSGWTVPAGTITTWAQDPVARASMTDADGDGRADILLTSGGGWTTIPIAFATSTNSFVVYNEASSLSVLTQAPKVKILTGCRRTVALPDHPTWHRCNDNGGVGGDLKGDLVLTGGPGWTTIPVGQSYGRTGSSNDGKFLYMNNPHNDFATWSQDPNAKAVSGDFDGNGRADLALLGGYDWWTVPAAFSYGNGWFSVVNLPAD